MSDSTSRENFFDNYSMHIGQAHLATAEREGEPGVVETQQVQRRGVQVMHGYFVLDRVVALLIGRAVDRTAFDTAPGKPH